MENRNNINIHREPMRLFEKDSDYPAVTVVVPAYNEGESVAITTESLLKLNYPKDKLNLILVDDGSKDNTWEVMQRYKDHPQIKIFTKPNGGKFSAQNLALDNTTTPFLGCLDSDSAVHPEALNRIMTYFMEDPKIMAVAPTIVSSKEENIIQKAQKTEYEMQIYMKKMMSLVNAIHVTPGPFSIFRKEVFDKIGKYKHAHTTEDIEIALRMQKHHMKIENAPDAYVYTNTPKTVKSLYKQRKRWIYGFIQNALDYRGLFLRKKYGNIAFINLPISFMLLFSVFFLVISILRSIYEFIKTQSLTISAVGINLSQYTPKLKLDPFFFNTSALMFISISLWALVFFSLYMSHRMLYGKSKINLSIIWFFLIYTLLAPFWVIKAMFNALRNYEASWTKEIDSR
ncbi:MAG: glycosyltransferase [Candidatus Elulimicrobiales bacterium]|nr:glycosyltransferase [Candidatus Elulimicrobiales bacterium]